MRLTIDQAYEACTYLTPFVIQLTCIMHTVAHAKLLTRNGNQAEICVVQIT